MHIYDPLHKCRIYHFLESSFYFSSYMFRVQLERFGDHDLWLSLLHPKSFARSALIEKGIWTFKLVWFRYNLSDNHCGIISGIVSRHSLVEVHPKCWSVKWLKVWLTTFFDFFDTQAWKYVPKCPTYPYFPRLSDRLSHFSRHYPRQITISFNYCMSGAITAQIEILFLLNNFTKNYSWDQLQRQKVICYRFHF